MVQLPPLSVVNHSTLDLTGILVEDVDGDGHVLDLGASPVEVEIFTHASHHASKRVPVMGYPRTNRVKVTLLLGPAPHPVSFVMDRHTSHQDGAQTLLDDAGERHRVVRHTHGATTTFLIFDVVDTKTWMKNLPDDALLSQLTLPGTHETCAREYGGNSTICQKLTLREQLEAGIRFLDIRCRHIDNTFTIHHGRVYQHLNFGAGVRDVCVKFLAEHPSECIVMSVKQEHDPEGNTRTFEETFEWYAGGLERYWYVGASVPRLVDVRRKMVLFRRFHAATTPMGLPAQPWPDDATFDINNPGADFRVQDQYKVPQLSDIKKKWEHVETLLAESRKAVDARWYVNFTSGSSSGAYPNAVAYGSPGYEGINDRLKSYLVANPTGKAGSVLMDFVEYPNYDNIANLIARNVFAPPAP
jgi:1-phosphatidylinositol phosphodiesterase